MKHFLIFLLINYASIIWANEETSYGWNIPNSSINIGGYLDMTYDQEREEKFLFNDIALLFSGNHNRFDLLGEIELSHISLDGKSNSRADVDLNIERLQLSYLLSDTQTIQVGRFNSDVGYWNQAPIMILQDTGTAPHLINHLFPKATTGVLYQQDIGEESSFSLTFQHNKDIAHQEENTLYEEKVLIIDRHIGISYHGIKENLSWRFSAGAYRETTKQRSRYMGIGSEYDGEIFSLEAEFFTQTSNNRDEEKPYSGYIQSTWHFKPSQDAVVRFENYKDDALNIKEQIYLIGYAYRPTNNIVLKSEYIYHSKLPLSRFVYSLSVLF
jgi:hypothetical protein